ncbi:hypothetical protein M0R72_07155 [Candidatus Pacearchaeota archaeon]|nr:hypothetical protein [Candidatus Pacearchaeota archaeon]
MKDMLARLEKADPETYQRITEFHWLDDIMSRHEYECDEWGHRATLSMPDFYEDAILQAVLQEAITSRGWLLEQSTYTVKPSAKIWKTADPIWKTYRGVGDSPVAALLAAYLSAIEEQA